MDEFPMVSGLGDDTGDYPISEWLVSHRMALQNDGTDQLVSPATHIDVESSAFEELIRAGVGSGDYAYVDRSFGGAVVYAGDGGLQVLILWVMRTPLYWMYPRSLISLALVTIRTIQMILK